MKQIKIEQLLPLLKSGWVAMEESGLWWWMQYKPFPFKNQWHYNKGMIKPLYWLFDIAPFDGDWKDSLIKVERSKKKSADRKDFDDFIEQHGVSPWGFLTEAILKEDFECWKKRRKNDKDTY